MATVDFSKFYQFLASFATNGKTWVDVADGEYGDDDGTVLKSEFRAFMNDKWDGEKSMTPDLVDAYWAKIDTNRATSRIIGTPWRDKNALNKNELDALDQKLEAYVELNKFINENVTAPNGLNSSSQKQWEANVSNELTKLYESLAANGDTSNWQDYLSAYLPEIKKKCTIQCFAEEYLDTLKTTILKDYPDYDVNKDKTLQKLIDDYINDQVGQNTTIKEIKAAIKEIIDDYFETAGLGNNVTTDVGDNDQMNDIQIAVIKELIKANLADEIKNYAGYEEDFNKALDDFINGKIKSSNFNELKQDIDTLVSEFKNSDVLKRLQACMSIDNTYGDLNANSSSINNTYGNLNGTSLTFPSLNLNNSTNSGATTNPRDLTVLGITKNNDLTTLLNKQTNDSSSNSNGLSKIFTFYDKLVQKFGKSIADKIVQNDIYLDAYKKIIEEVKEKIKSGEFGLDENGNYNKSEVENYIIEQLMDCIEQFIPNNLDNMKISELNTLYTTLSEMAESQVDVSKHRRAAIIYCDTLIKKNSQYSQYVAQIFGENYINTINSLTPGDLKDAMKSLMNLVDGGVPSSGTGNSDLAVQDVGKERLLNKQQSTQYYLNNWCHLKEDSNNFQDAKNNAAEGVPAMIETLVSSFKSEIANYDEGALERAAASLQDYYIQLIYVATDGNTGDHKKLDEESRTEQISYLNLDGTGYTTVNATYSQKTLKKEYDNHEDYSDDNSGLMIHEATNGTGWNSYRFGINMKVAMQKLIEFYNAAL